MSISRAKGLNQSVSRIDKCCARIKAIILVISESDTKAFKMGPIMHVTLVWSRVVLGANPNSRYLLS